MSQKYEQFSKVKDYEKAEIVDKMNIIDMDSPKRIINPQCESCRNCCPDFNFDETSDKCKNYSPRLTLKEINKEIKKQNINIKKLSDEYGLSRNLMYEMLKAKRVMKFSYYSALEDRIFENDEYVPYFGDEYE